MGGAILVLAMLWMGAAMGCATQKPDVPPRLPWAGKFPVLVIAHRGFSGAAPENTLAAFKKAIDAGADMVELDVHLSKDGHVVVIHDDTLDRTTNGKGNVASYTLSQLSEFDAGSWFNPRFSGERIPTLQEVLNLARGRIPVHIEIKKGDLGPYSIADLANRSLQEVEKAGMLSQVLFGSFDPAAIDRVSQSNPRARVALIHNQPWTVPQEVTGGRNIAVLSCGGKVLTQSNISGAHRRGLRIFVWTLNTDEQMQHFLNLEVDGIITNHPDRLVNILRKKYP